MQYFSNSVALIIVDPQNDFCTGGALEVKGGEEIMPVINGIKPYFKTTVITRDSHPKDHFSFASNQGVEAFSAEEMSYGTQVFWPDHCVEGTRGANFHSELNIAKTDLILRKGTDPKVDSLSAFLENDRVSRPKFKNGNTLEQELKQRKGE